MGGGEGEKEAMRRIEERDDGDSDFVFYSASFELLFVFAILVNPPSHLDNICLKTTKEENMVEMHLSQREKKNGGTPIRR